MKPEVNNNVESIELLDKLIGINRVAKVIKGGRRFSFNAMVVVGDKNGRIGLGFGKANEVVYAVNKAKSDAKKNMFTVPVIRGSIPHKIVGRFCASKIMLKPASPGTGVIAGGAARPILELAGINTILTKSIGSNNTFNLAKATINGLRNLQGLDATMKRRGISAKKIFGQEDTDETKDNSDS